MVSFQAGSVFPRALASRYPPPPLSLQGLFLRYSLTPYAGDSAHPCQDQSDRFNVQPYFQTRSGFSIYLEAQCIRAIRLASAVSLRRQDPNAKIFLLTTCRQICVCRLTSILLPLRPPPSEYIQSTFPAFAPRPQYLGQYPVVSCRQEAERAGRQHRAAQLSRAGS